MNILNKHLTEVDILIANMYMKRKSISLVMSLIQIKTTMKWHSTPTRITKIEKMSNIKC